MAFLKNPKNPKTVRIFGFRTPQKKTFRAIKTVVSKRGGRKLTLGGPQINPRNPFWGAANRPSSIYIYIYIYNREREEEKTEATESERRGIERRKELRLRNGGRRKRENEGKCQMQIDNDRERERHR